ncbi:MAG: S-layer homology domain-containing protein [Candidatus Marinimicrobia bacterium]|nr:S-layer homology domain-containing protein [Candidatus Neomarinimicrobiota bacterium]
MRTRILLALTGGLIIGMVGCAPKATSQSDLDTPEYHYKLGARSLENGEYQTALNAFQRAVNLDKKFALGWSGLGLTKAYMNDFEAGRSAVDKGVSLASKNPVTYVYRGRFWTVNSGEKKWLDKAEKDFERALDLNPGDEAANYYLGEAYLNGMRFRDAEAKFAAVVEGEGELSGKADGRWSQTQKIVRARPGTEAGKKIAIKMQISRADLAVLFAEELKLREVFARASQPTGQPGFQPPSAFTGEGAPVTLADVQGSWAEPWIREVVELGVFEADPSGNFYPDQVVTRVDYAMSVQRILSKATNDPSLDTRYFGESPSRFTDVSSSHFAYSAMALCAERGIMKADLMTGKFNPTGNVDGADALLIVREVQNSLRITF